ncbi:hypothetical protein V1508DRAFT_428250 [Lipomyces doorenjongii]|uniref:uncharacterized protein n=1 Tax=Lipomyces doorenjongii TaxID=383834 RepID=UPI0034CEC8A9
MPPRFPDSFLPSVLFMAESGSSVDQIAKELGCCTKTVKRIKHNFKLWQSHQSPPEGRLGRPSKINDAMLVDLLEHLLRHPLADLEDMRSFIYDQFGVIVSASNISRTLKKNSWTKKKIRKNAAERSQALRDDWLLQLSDWTAEQLMFVDESAANEKTGDRKDGWAPVGVTPDESVPAFRSERYSVLLCYTVDGYIACNILRGSFKSDNYAMIIQVVRERSIPGRIQLCVPIIVGLNAFGYLRGEIPTVRE